MVQFTNILYTRVNTREHISHSNQRNKLIEINFCCHAYVAIFSGVECVINNPLWELLIFPAVIIPLYFLFWCVLFSPSVKV